MAIDIIRFLINVREKISTAVYSLFSDFVFVFSNVVIILLDNDISMNKIIHERTRNLDIFITRRKRRGILKKRW